MSTGWIVLIVVLVILIGVLVGLYFFGKKAEKKQAAQQEQMDAMAQTVNMLIIDKKKMKLKEANLPSAVLENTPKDLFNSDWNGFFRIFCFRRGHTNQFNTTKGEHQESQHIEEATKAIWKKSTMRPKVTKRNA